MHDQHLTPKTDIQIAQETQIRPILDVAHKRLGIDPKDLLLYGHYKAKISLDYLRTLNNRPNGKLILVTAITPTPAGEGKTTTTVGLGDALNKLGKRAIICLARAESGPVLWRERRRCWRRLRAGPADGRHQPAFHR